MAARKAAEQLTAILLMVCLALSLAATYTPAASRRWLCLGATALTYGRARSGTRHMI